MSSTVSVIIPTVNEGENLRTTVEGLQATVQCGYEIVVVDNGSTDGSSDFIQGENGNSHLHLLRTGERLGVSGARNTGAEQAWGETLIFVDAHMKFPLGWVLPLLDVLEQPNVGVAAPGINAWGAPEIKGFGMRWRSARLDVEWLPRKSPQTYAVPGVPGGCMAFRREVFQEIGGFDAGMISYGSEDLEICLRAWLLGYEVVIVPHVEVSHLFRTRFPYQVNWTHVVHNMLRTVYAHFSSERAGRVIATLGSLPGFEPAMRQVQAGDIWDRRDELERQRQYDDDWFFARFGLSF